MHNNIKAYTDVYDKAKTQDEKLDAIWELLTDIAMQFIYKQD